jgi:hypothetical protein
MSTDNASGKKAVASNDENKHLLIEMGERLLQENVISSYQLVQEVGIEINQYTHPSGWEGDVDRQGGSFTQDEIDNSTAWR